MRHRELSVTYRKQTLICLYEGTTTRRVNRRTKHFFQKKKKKRHPRGDKDRYNRYKNFPYPNFLLLVLKSFLPIYRQTDRSVCENYPYRFVFSPPLFIKTTWKHDTSPYTFIQTLSYVLCSRRFSKGQVAYCNIFKRGRRIVAGERKKKKREAENVGAFIMKLRNCKLSKYNGRAPALVQVWIFFPLPYFLLELPSSNLGIELLATKVTPI